MSDNRTVLECKEIQRALRNLRLKMREREDETEYREWCDGIIMAAIAALGVIAGDFK